MSTASELRNIFTAARPLIEQWLDVADQIAALREAATAKGLDWSQVKALLKAQVQDDRDGTGEGKRVRRLVEKAEFASSYADMLGLAKVNENNFSGDVTLINEREGNIHLCVTIDERVAEVLGRTPPENNVPPHDPDTGEVEEDDEDSAASPHACASESRESGSSAQPAPLEATGQAGSETAAPHSESGLADFMPAPNHNDLAIPDFLRRRSA